MKLPLFTFLIIIYVTLFAGRARGSHYSRKIAKFSPRLTRQAGRYGVPGLNYRGNLPVNNAIGPQGAGIKALPLAYGGGGGKISVPRPVNGVGSYSFGGRYANKPIHNPIAPDFGGALREQSMKVQSGFAPNIGKRPLLNAGGGGSGQYTWSSGGRFP